MAELRIVENARTAVLEAAKGLAEKRLVEGTSGNVSARMDATRICITPSSVDYLQMEDGDLVVIDLDGQPVEGNRPPSSEKSLHLACYQAFPEIGSVIHSHAVHATMFAAARKPIPACVDELVVYVGGEVEVAEYAQSGSVEVGAAAVRALASRAAALLANHGMVAIGKDPAEALKITALVERSAEIALGAVALGGPSALPERVVTDFGSVYTMLRLS